MPQYDLNIAIFDTIYRAIARTYTLHNLLKIEVTGDTLSTYGLPAHGLR